MAEYVALFCSAFEQPVSAKNMNYASPITRGLSAGGSIVAVVERQARRPEVCAKGAYSATRCDLLLCSPHQLAEDLLGTLEKCTANIYLAMLG
jgi:hypothetical protein